MKEIHIKPRSLKGEISVPPSKSMSHRALICSGLSSSESLISNVEFSQDIIATSSTLDSLGISIRDLNNKGERLHSLRVKGNNELSLKNNIINCYESGSTLRFIIPIAMLTCEEVTFCGEGKLGERPLDTYYEIFKEQNIAYKNNEGKLPLTVKGTLKAGEYKVKGNISSQFISGLLFTLPLLHGDSKIIITTEMESKGYIDLTLDMLKRFNIHIENKEYREFIIKGNQKYLGRNYKVEGDFSQGAFFLVAGLLGEEISLLDLDINSSQGDKEILNIIEKMKGSVEYDGGRLITRKKETKGSIIDASQCPDLVPIVSVLAALSEGETRIIKAERLRLKESDRLKAMFTELSKLGADIFETEDGLVINGKKNLKGGRVSSWNDHRIAMALAVASIKCEEEVIIENSEVVKKSYPDFWEDFKSLGGDIYECHMG